MDIRLLLRFVLAVFLNALQADAATYDHDVNVAEECRIRDGLPNVLAKLKAGGPVRIAYLGGSITAVNVTDKRQTGRLHWHGNAIDLRLSPWEVSLIRD